MGVWYRSGTVSVTNGSKNVVGVDTYFTLNAAVGDVFTLGGDTIYEIEAIADDTHLTLVTPYLGVTAAAQSYSVIRNFTGTTNATLASKLTTLLNAWQSREDEFRAWVGGTATGGPNSDGYYPLTDAVGISYSVPCPAKIRTIAALYAGDAAGTANAVTITLSPELTGHTVGQPIRFRATAANTGAVTIAINALTAQPLQRLSGSALRPGDIQVGQICEIVWTGTAYLLASAVYEATTLSGFSASQTPGANQIAVLTTGGNIVLGGGNDDGVNRIQSVGTIRSKPANSSSYGRFTAQNEDDSSTIIVTAYGSGVTTPVFGFSAGNWSMLVANGTNNNGLAIGTYTSKPVIFGVNNASVARLSTSGNFLVGTPLDTVYTAAGRAVNVTAAAGASRIALQGATTADYTAIDFGGGTQRHAVIQGNADGSLSLLTNASAGTALVTEKMKILSSGLVGIGMTPVTNKLEVSGSQTLYGNLLITSTDGITYRYLDLKRTVSGTVYDVVIDSDSGNGNARLIHQTGGVTDASLALGASGCTASVPIIAASGIKYGGGTVAMTAYDEGNFTPIVYGGSTAGVGTYSVQSGSYTRLGRMVFISLRVSWTAHTGAGNLYISGLPFQTNSSTYFALTAYQSSLTVGSGKQLVVLTSPGNSYLSLNANDLAGGASINVQIDTAADVIITGSYTV